MSVLLYWGYSIVVSNTHFSIFVDDDININKSEQNNPCIDLVIGEVFETLLSYVV